MSDWREVHIAADLCDAAEAKFGRAFGGVDELVSFLLRELVRGDTARLDEAELKAVEQRLKDLGYM